MNVIKKIIRKIIIFNRLLSYAIRKDIKPRFEQADVILICHDDNRTVTWKDFKYSPLIDTIRDDLIILNLKVLSISSPYSFEKNPYGNSININKIISKAEIVSGIKKIYGEINYRETVIKAWLEIILKVKPKIIIGIQPSIELCIAAHEKKIWIADLQHGIISGEGYYGLNARAKFGQKGWPSCILCWNLESSEWLNKNVNLPIDKMIVGNPWIDRFIFRKTDDQLVDFYEKKFKKIFNHTPDKRKKILVSLQWGKICEEFPPAGLPLELINIIKATAVKYDWLIRLHPVFINGVGSKKAYQILNNEFFGINNVLIEEITEIPLPLLLDRIDLHLTVSSATAVEAARFGVRSGLLGANSEELKEWFSKEIKAGFVDLLDLNQCSIESWILKNIDTKKKLIKNKTKDYHIFMKKILSKFK
jgi:hypothetical protein